MFGVATSFYQRPASRVYFFMPFPICAIYYTLSILPAEYQVSFILPDQFLRIQSAIIHTVFDVTASSAVLIGKLPFASREILKMVATFFCLHPSLIRAIQSSFNVMNVLDDLYCVANVLNSSIFEIVSVLTILSIVATFSFAIVYFKSNMVSKVWLNVYIVSSYIMKSTVK